jgi:hypothetical protein
MSKSPFLETVRENIRLRGYSLRTEQTYLHWIRRFILFNGKKHPQDIHAAEVRDFLNWLANKRNVAIITQKVALYALVFLYKHIVQRELGDLGFSHAVKQRFLPVVLTSQQVLSIIEQLNGHHKLIVSLLYGSGYMSDQTKGWMSYLSPQLCYSLAAEWLRYPHGTRTAWAQRCFHYTNIHPCYWPALRWHNKPVRSQLIKP